MERYEIHVCLFQEFGLPGFTEEIRQRHWRQLVTYFGNHNYFVEGTDQHCVLVYHASVDIVFDSRYQSEDGEFYVCGTLFSGTEKMTVISYYRHPNATFEFENLFAYLKSFDNPVVIGGDFNMQHELWGAEEDFPLTDSCENFLINVSNIECRLEIQNSGHATRFSRHSGKESFLDLTLSSVPIMDWTCRINENLFSDHYPITFSISASINDAISESEDPRPIWKLPESEDDAWARFRYEIEQRFAIFQDEVESRHLERQNLYDRFEYHVNGAL